LAFGVAPRADHVAFLVGALTLAILCFAALGLAISTAIRRAETSGAITNGTYLPLALVSGTFSSALVLPSWLDHLVSALPIKALTTSLRAAYDPTAGVPVASVLVLVAWAMIGIALARRFFRWEPSWWKISFDDVVTAMAGLRGEMSVLMRWSMGSVWVRASRSRGMV